MVLHPSRRTALPVNLPFNSFIYEINETLIDYVQSQCDLWVNVNTKLTRISQLDKLVTKAKSRLDHFSKDKWQKKHFTWQW